MPRTTLGVLGALALATIMATTPALAAGISVDMPNLSFPDGKTTLSTQGCDATTAEACPVRS